MRNTSRPPASKKTIVGVYVTRRSRAHASAVTSAPWGVTRSVRAPRPKRATSNGRSAARISGRGRMSRCSSSHAAQYGVSKTTASGLPPGWRGRPQEERLVGKLGARGFGRLAREVRGERLALLVGGGDVVDRRLEPVRRPVAVEPRGDVPLLVEEQERRRELHVEVAGDRLLAPCAAVDPRRLAVAPDVERDGDEAAAHLVDDRALREVRH